MGSGTSSAALLAWPTLQRVDTIEIERRMVDVEARTSRIKSGSVDLLERCERMILLTQA